MWKYWRKGRESVCEVVVVMRDMIKFAINTATIESLQNTKKKTMKCQLKKLNIVKNQLQKENT